MRAIAPGFELDTKLVGAFPFVNHILKRLRFEKILLKRLPPPDPRALLSTQSALGLLLRNLVLAHVPLYCLGEWARAGVPALMGLEPEQLRLLNDDRVGRALDRLFDADRQALLTDLVVFMVQEFEVSLEEFHNDSTSITLQGKYKNATGQRVRGKPTLRAAFGHNKDHRPDLKQILWILTLSADGSVPVHFKVADGNTQDTTTHVETWNALRQLVGSPHFLYVADSKLCTRGNLKHIHEQGGRFITVLPRTWKEDTLFKDWIQTHTPQWDEVARKPHPRLRNGPPDIFCAVPSPNPDADGFRVIWYKSSHKMERDAEARGHALQVATKALNEIKAKLEGPRPRWRSQASVAQAVEQILAKTGANRWMDYEVVAIDKPSYHQEKRGRAGTKTRWRRRLKTRFQLAWTLRQDQIDTTHVATVCSPSSATPNSPPKRSWTSTSPSSLSSRGSTTSSRPSSPGSRSSYTAAAASRPCSSSTSSRCSSMLFWKGRFAAPWPSGVSRSCRSIRKIVSVGPPRRSVSSRLSGACSATCSARMAR